MPILVGVTDTSLEEAIELAGGRNFSWFFKDWIVGGGGHPRFDVSYRWVPERKQIDLTIKQIQADLPFENEFQLPVSDHSQGELVEQLHAYLLQQHKAGRISVVVLDGITRLARAYNLTAPASGEYRALVCLFLAGGNDSFNMLAPFSGPSATAARTRKARCGGSRIFRGCTGARPRRWRRRSRQARS